MPEPTNERTRQMATKKTAEQKAARATAKAKAAKPRTKVTKKAEARLGEGRQEVEPDRGGNQGF